MHMPCKDQLSLTLDNVTILRASISMRPSSNPHLARVHQHASIIEPPLPHAIKNHRCRRVRCHTTPPLQSSSGTSSR